MLVLMLSLLLAPLAVPPDYAAVWYSLPERHRAHVRAVVVDRTSGGQARRTTLSIHLPPYRSEKQAAKTLTHELCHVLAYARPDLEAAWQARFWPGGKPVGTLPHAGNDQDEDWAWSCEKARDGDGPDDPDRAVFFREQGVWP